MTAAVKIGQITNADVYYGNQILVGRFKEFGLPDLEYTEVKHETLGQIAVLSVPGRPLKEMKGKAVLDFLDPELVVDVYNPTKGLKFALHSYLDVFDANGLDLPKSGRLITNVTIMVRKSGGKAFKLGDNFEGEIEFTCNRFVQGLADQTPIREIDVFSQVNRIAGKDVWPTY
jgi:phage tail tube protein FII